MQTCAITAFQKLLGNFINGEYKQKYKFMTTFIQAITLTVSIVIMVLVAKWQVNNDIKKMQKRLDKETNNKKKL